MLYAILCYDHEAVTGAWSQEEEDAVMGRLMTVQKGLEAEGRLGPVARLMPTTSATTLRKSAEEPLVIDGPFAETKEQFLGFYVVECENLDAALDVARDLAKANPGNGAYEIRPVMLYRPNETKAETR
ncbi:YciI family protein [Pararhizobium haloflavum]|uniref:YciI family protein n=1 Tax=Pararhizobium haloflavum TaxID=2037914 RepID=UPI000C17A843|nr:YciI family protein [Pararhizobium haloflavum]